MGNCAGGKGGKKDPTLLTEEEIKLLLDNTKLTRPQINALHQNFLKECPSGKLSKKDFIKVMTFFDILCLFYIFSANISSFMNGRLCDTGVVILDC